MKQNKIVMVEKNIKDLKPYDKNTKVHTKEQVAELVESISEFGFVQPVLVDKNNIIVAGHGRVMAAKKAGKKTVPVICLNDLSEEQIKAYRLADNKLNESDWNMDFLQTELEDLGTELDMSLFGFDLDFNIEEEKIEVEEDDYEEKQIKKARTKKGDIYKLGQHRLICGDSFDPETFMKLLGNKRSDLLFLDPPFDLEDYGWTKNICFNKSGNPVILMASDKQTVALLRKIKNFRQFIIHDRIRPVMSCPYTPMSQHTIISLFCKNPSKFFNNLHDHFTSIIQCKKEYKDAEDELNSKMGKPLPVINELISHYTHERNIVLDMFGGGGSVLMVCEKTNRICYEIELDPVQCDLIVDRWEQLTGKKAKLLK